ncbi:hypothetical protein BLNAU_1803 [Blattamonas nauphoetae]|uniref:FYVE-type domain-containing protein n=1 Tax=Blattamonas nauphoetae TaxID=2049346 RepID=A0ABQ9YHQ3_9EUKA|nr:hypothetical protein BLNAU_1803 [Blattamonas nauphoetae]
MTSSPVSPSSQLTVISPKESISFKNNCFSVFFKNSYLLLPNEMTSPEATIQLISVQPTSCSSETISTSLPFSKTSNNLASTRLGPSFILFVGGQNSTSSSPGIFLFSLETRTFNEVPFIGISYLNPSLLIPQVGHALCSLHEGRMVVCFGGIVNPADGLPNNKTLVLDTTTFEWSPPHISSFLPPSRGFHTLVPWGTMRAVLFGGTAANGVVMQDLYVYNSVYATWTMIQATNEADAPCRYAHSAVMVYDNLFVFGGYDEHGTITNTLFRFDFVTLTWTKVTFASSQSPPALAYSSLCLMDLPNREESSFKQLSAPPTSPLRSEELKSIKVLLSGGYGDKELNTKLFSFTLPIADFYDYQTEQYIPRSTHSLEDIFADPSTLSFTEQDGTIARPEIAPFLVGNLPTDAKSVSKVDREQKAPKWVPDEATSNCRSCRARFTHINRRHHCRNCGYIFCGKCCYLKADIPDYNIKNQRVCNDCFTLLSHRAGS